MSAEGFDSEPLLLGVRVIGPTPVGVMVKVWAAEELENVRTMGVLSPPPDGVIVIVPLYTAFGVTVKLPDAVFSVPPLGPVNENPLAGTKGVTEFELADAALDPALFTAFTEQV